MTIYQDETREINLTYFYLRPTYAGVIQCSDEMLPWLNNRIISELNYPEKIWGTGRRHLGFGIDQLDTEKPLPPYTVSMWLISSVISEDAFGSALVVTFLTEMEGAESIKSLAEGVVSEIDWEKEAIDYQL